MFTGKMKNGKDEGIHIVKKENRVVNGVGRGVQNQTIATIILEEFLAVYKYS